MMIQKMTTMAQGAAARVGGKIAQLERTGGQGTTEYAVLIAVVVVAAVFLVMAFGDQLNTAWQKAIDSMTSVTNYTPGGGGGN